MSPAMRGLAAGSFLLCGLGKLHVLAHGPSVAYRHQGVETMPGREFLSHQTGNIHSDSSSRERSWGRRRETTECCFFSNSKQRLGCQSWLSVIVVII